jgi:ribosomal protein L37E
MNPNTPKKIKHQSEHTKFKQIEEQARKDALRSKANTRLQAVYKATNQQVLRISQDLTTAQEELDTYEKILKDLLDNRPNGPDITDPNFGNAYKLYKVNLQSWTAEVGQTKSRLATLIDNKRAVEREKERVEAKFAREQAQVEQEYALKLESTTIGMKSSDRGYLIKSTVCHVFTPERAPYHLWYNQVFKPLIIPLCQDDPTRILENLKRKWVSPTCSERLLGRGSEAEFQSLDWVNKQLEELYPEPLQNSETMARFMGCRQRYDNVQDYTQEIKYWFQRAHPMIDSKDITANSLFKQQWRMGLYPPFGEAVVKNNLDDVRSFDENMVIVLHRESMKRMVENGSYGAPLLLDHRTRSHFLTGVSPQKNTKSSTSSTSTSTSTTSTTSTNTPQQVCAKYIEGRCNRGNHCPYLHATLPANYKLTSSNKRDNRRQRDDKQDTTHNNNNTTTTNPSTRDTHKQREPSAEPFKVDDNKCADNWVSRPCSRCDGKHPNFMCKSDKLKCHSCGGVGHTSYMCPKKTCAKCGNPHDTRVHGVSQTKTKN